MNGKPARRYRSNASIIADILEAVKEEERLGKTRIMQKANLSTDRLEPRLSELIQQGLIQEETEDDRKYYRLTERGFDFLEQYQRASAFLNAFGIGL